jgi:hypothetical protein
MKKIKKLNIHNTKYLNLFILVVDLNFFFFFWQYWGLNSGPETY